MGKRLNISDKLTTGKPSIVIGEKEYEVDNTMESVIRFDETANSNDPDAMFKAIEVALGAKAAKELNVKKMSVPNYKILTIAIMAAMNDMDYEDAEARFLRKTQ